MPVRVGVVSALNRYPVKSMQGEPMMAAGLVHTWMPGDRQYAFVRAADTSDFPWLTARQVPDLVRWRARYDGDDPKAARLTVTAPDGEAFDIRDPALAERLAAAAGEPVRLLRLGRGAFDAMPLSVLSTATVEGVGRAHGAAVMAGRFRANVIVTLEDGSEGEAGWVGRRLRFGGGDGGSAEVSADWAIPRCAMVGIDPATGERDAGLVRTVVQAFGNRIGVYCGVRRPGRVSVGDAVWLIDGVS